MWLCIGLVSCIRGSGPTLLCIQRDQTEPALRPRARVPRVRVVRLQLREEHHERDRTGKHIHVI
jgi:hypothetical protein